MNGTLPSRREHLDDMTCLAHASGFTDGKTHWTDLSIYYREDDNMPFVSVVELIVTDEDGNLSEERFKSYASGTVDGAVKKFDDTLLTQQLQSQLPEDMGPFPDGDTRRMLAAQARRGYQGPPDILEALGWLYEGQPFVGPTNLAKAVEADFDVPWRTVYNAMTGTPPTGWAKAFVRALAFFDRGKWRSDKVKEKRGG